MNSPQRTACLAKGGKNMLMIRGHFSLHRFFVILEPLWEAETGNRTPDPGNRTPDAGHEDRHLSNLILARLGPAFARQWPLPYAPGSQTTTAAAFGKLNSNINRRAKTGRHSHKQTDGQNNVTKLIFSVLSRFAVGNNRLFNIHREN